MLVTLFWPRTPAGTKIVHLKTGVDFLPAVTLLASSWVTTHRVAIISLRAMISLQQPHQHVILRRHILASIRDIWSQRSHVELWTATDVQKSMKN